MRRHRGKVDGFVGDTNSIDIIEKSAKKSEIVTKMKSDIDQELGESKSRIMDKYGRK